MNNLYTVVAALAIAGTATAQLPSSGVLKEAKTFNPLSASALNHPVQEQASGLDNGQRDVFYSEDFSGTNGLPAGWTTVDDLTPAGQTPVLFAWANSPGAVTPASGNQPLILTFLAPGAANGFLWANSDRGLTSAPATNHLTRLTTSPIDCSGQSSVLLTMKSTIGVFDLDADTAVKVRVSTDGVNWTNFAPFPCLKAGNINPPCERFSYNPQNVAVDITSVAANQATVYLQFQWRGGWEYYWAIDDVELSALPEHELKMDYGYTSQTGGGYEFGHMPTSQMPSTMYVGAQIVNFGTADQTNVTVTVSVRDESDTEVATSTSNVGTMSYQDTVVTDEQITFSPALPTGIYTAHFTVSSDDIGLDDNPANNGAYRYFGVTDDLYSIDGIGVVPDSILTVVQTGTSSFPDNTQDVRFLNYFEVHTPETFTGGEILLGPNTGVGSYFSLSVFDTVDVFAVELGSPLAQSDLRVITQQDLNEGRAGVTFLDPINLPVGAYYISANLYQENGSDLYILDDLTTPQPNAASMLYTPVDPDNQFLYGGNGTAWAVRISSNPTIGVQENPALQGVTMYPSPTSGPVEIRTKSNGLKTLDVYNALGKLVLHTSFSGMDTSINLDGNAPGIYTVRVGSGALYNVQRIALK